MRQQGVRLLLIAMVCLILASLTILLMPVAASAMDQDKNGLAYAVAAVFWLTTIAGYVCFFQSRKILSGRRKGNKDATREKGEMEKKNNPLPIAKSQYGLIANIMFVVSILGYLLTQVIFHLAAAWGYLFIFLFVLSFHMQIVLNSETFIINVDLKDRKGKQHESKKTHVKA